jgi:hypothetical protein
MATIQGQINTPRDTTIQATNTALGLLGKDASLQDIKTALLAIVDAITPSIENDYDELTNKPQVNGVTLSGNKTSKQLGIRQTIPMNSAAYAQLTSAEKMDPDKDYIITDLNATSAPIDDNNTSNNKVWSSQKTDNTKADKEAILQTVEECSASTDPDDIAGAAALSSLNSAISSISDYDILYEGTPSAAESWETKNLNSGKKFSDYKFIIVQIMQYTNAFNAPVFEPLSVFKTQSSSLNRIMVYANTSVNSQIYYISDTTFGMLMSNITNGFKTRIYGFMKV